jgi:hypothetical protein
MEPPKVPLDFIDLSTRKFKSLLNGPPNHLVPNTHLADSLYDQAKSHETKTRNLKRALTFYVQAALNGEKVNSCIKDFASVVHQCGYTLKALTFLEDMREVYKGDLDKYDHLIKNLAQQLKPTGRHQYRNILIDLLDLRLANPHSEIPEMFCNSSRIRSIEGFDDLGFTAKSHRGRYFLLGFDSFSAAKKTLETFKEEEWFGVNKFWIDSSLHIVAEALNGKGDFERGLILNKGQIEKIDG